MQIPDLKNTPFFTLQPDQSIRVQDRTAPTTDNRLFTTDDFAPLPDRDIRTFELKSPCPVQEKSESIPPSQLVPFPGVLPVSAVGVRCAEDHNLRILEPPLFDAEIDGSFRAWSRFPEIRILWSGVDTSTVLGLRQG